MQIAAKIALTKQNLMQYWLYWPNFLFVYWGISTGIYRDQAQFKLWCTLQFKKDFCFSDVTSHKWSILAWFLENRKLISYSILCLFSTNFVESVSYALMHAVNAIETRSFMNRLTCKNVLVGAHDWLIRLFV